LLLSNDREDEKQGEEKVRITNNGTERKKREKKKESLKMSRNVWVSVIMQIAQLFEVLFRTAFFLAVMIKKEG